VLNYDVIAQKLAWELTARQTTNKQKFAGTQLLIGHAYVNAEYLKKNFRWLKIFNRNTKNTQHKR